MSNHFQTGLMATAGASGIATSIMGWFGHYAAGIGAIFTILTFFTWLFFLLRRDKQLSQAGKNKLEITKLKKQLSELSDRKTDKNSD